MSRYYLVWRLLDTSGVMVRKESYVSPELRGSYTDLLLSVPLRPRDADEASPPAGAAAPADVGAYVYVLFEHKSDADRWVLLQMLRYMAEIWRKHHETHRGRPTVPPIFPVIFATTPRAASLLVDFRALVRVEFATERFVPDFEVLVYDALSDEARRATLRVAVAVGVFQAAVREGPTDMAEAARMLRRARDELPSWRDLTDASLEYPAARLDSHDLSTLARQLETAGFEEGEQQVVTILEKSRLEAKCDTLIRLVRMRFGLSDEEADRIRAVRDVGRIDAALDAVALDESKDAVFRQLD